MILEKNCNHRLDNRLVKKLYRNFIAISVWVYTKLGLGRLQWCKLTLVIELSIGINFFILFQPQFGDAFLLKISFILKSGERSDFE